MQHLTDIAPPEVAEPADDPAEGARIALVDDDRAVLTAMALALRKEGLEVETFTDARLALDAFRKRGPDLAILDVRMPRMDGLEMLRQLRRFSTMPVIFLTSRDEELDEVLGLRLGADDYLRKPFSPRLLVERIRAHLRRQAMSAAVPAASAQTTPPIERGPLRMDPNRHAVAWFGAPVVLTVTEFLLLQSLAQRPGFVKTRDQLMDVAYDEDTYVDDRTIDSHIKRLRKKFRAVDPDFAAIETLYGIGYRFSLPGSAEG